MNEKYLKIEKCKKLPNIENLKDCREFYKIFFKNKLYDLKYGEDSHYDYRHKPIEQLTLDEVLTSFTVIQREDYWEGGYDYIFERYLADKTFERLYDRLQELVSEMEEKLNLERLNKFLKENELINPVPVRIWNEYGGYKGYNIYYAKYTKKGWGINYVLINKEEIRLATIEEIKDFLHIFTNS